jgi:uncharacterized membrane protein
MIKKSKDAFFTTGRMEAFSDGVIAIIITLMILEVHAPTLDENGDFKDIPTFLHHLVAYCMSFLMLGIYWVNHHNFFHKIKEGDRKLLWMNLNLLFWMSLIPLPTGFLGSYYTKPIASVFYGAVLFMTSISFTWMGAYASKIGLFGEQIPKDVQKRNMRRNRLGLGLYLAAMGLAYVNVFISFGIFIFIAAMYFMPKLGIVKKESDLSIPEIIADDLYKVEGKIEDAIVSKIHGNKSKQADADAKVEKAAPKKKSPDSKPENNK